MAFQTIRIKRRLSGSPGAPASLASSELAFNHVDSTLYIGYGDNGSGQANSVIAIGGAAALGDYVTLNTDQTISGNKTFTGDVNLANANVSGLSLDNLDDVSVTGATSGQVLQFNGTSWVPITQSPDGILSVTADAGTGLYAITNGGDVTIGGIDATQAVKGVVRFATAAEIAAGTAGNLAISPADLAGAAYQLPIASDTVLGGIKVGGGLSITGDGVLSTTLQGALKYKGATDITGTAPSSPENGDLYINEVAGLADASWTGIAGESVLVNAFVIWDGNSSTWNTADLAVDAGVTSISGTDPITVDVTNPAAPIIGVEDATTSQKGVVTLATATDIENGTANKVVTSDQLAAYVAAGIPIGSIDGDLLMWNQATGAWNVSNVIDGGTF